MLAVDIELEQCERGEDEATLADLLFVDVLARVD